MKTATKTYEQINTHAESIKNDSAHDLREKMEVGNAWAQGDVLIRMIADVPDATLIDNPKAQLAPGNTQVSRHCLSSLDGVLVYRAKNSTVLEGPVFTVETEVTVEHPEHGDVILGPGCYAITYQRAFAEELRRIAD